MSRHFIPPLPPPSTTGSVSDHIVQGQGNDENESSFRRVSEFIKGDGTTTRNTNDIIQQAELMSSSHNQDDIPTMAQVEPMIQQEDQRQGMEPSPLLMKDEVSQAEWPSPFDDETSIQKNALHLLPPDSSQIQQQIETNGKITVRSITWNQQAQELPSAQLLRDHLLPSGYFHVIAVGTQECENTISKSILYPGKDNWERVCGEALGDDYELLRGHSLQASHL